MSSIQFPAVTLVFYLVLSYLKVRIHQQNASPLKKKFLERHKNAPLMLRLTKMLHGPGKIVVLDYDLCVLHGLMCMQKKGVHLAALTKKRRYRNFYVDGEKPTANPKKGIGAVDELHGDIENVPLCVFYMEEEDYVMIIMSTYGENERVEEDRFWIIGGESITLNYP